VDLRVGLNGIGHRNPTAVDRLLALITPPVIDPRSSYLGVAMLAGRLAADGQFFMQIDANLRFFDWFVSARTATRLCKETGNAMFADIAPELDWAKSVLRGSAFYDQRKRDRARNIIDLYCRSTGIRYAKSDMRTHSYSYDHAENSESLLIKAIDNPENNPFDEYYEEDLFVRLRAGSVSCAALSITNSHQLFPGFLLARRLKNLGIGVVVGGACVTKMRENIRRNPDFFNFFDVAVFFEGDDCIGEIARHGIEAFKGDGALASFSMLVGSNIYNVERAQSVQPSGWRTPVFVPADCNLAFRPRNVLPTLTAKGCSWGRCTFCTIPATSGAGGELHRDLGAHASALMVHRLQTEYECSHFVVTDENFSARRQLEFAQGLLAQNLSISWLSYSRFDQAYTDDVCQTIRASGCRKLLIGLESVNDETLRHMKKGVTRRIINSNVERFIEARLPIHLYCMVGFPGESIDDATNTLEFVLEFIRRSPSCLVSASFSEFMLTKGSEVYLNPAQYGVRLLGDPEDDLITCDYAYLDGSDTQKWTEFRKFANKLIVQEFGYQGMVGWEEYALLLDDHDRDPAEVGVKHLELINLPPADWNRYRVAKPPISYYKTCTSSPQGILVTNLDSYKSLTLSTDAYEIFSLLARAENLQRDYCAVSSATQITEERFADLIARLCSGGLIQIDRRSTE
jgi:anaerobic magnesium-protoporphyrin IX monomethyl ester cyclase